MIELRKKHFIAAGAFCSCYQHPESLDLCVKIPTDNSRANKRLRADLAYYKALNRKNVDLQHIANYLGSNDSNKGMCYMYECIRDDDMQVSHTLEYYLDQEDVDREQIYKSLTDLGQYLVDNRIMIGDIHARNILLRKESDGSFTPVIVDGIGDRVAIKVLNMIPSLLTAKIIRRWNRFLEKDVGIQSFSLSC